MVAVAVGVGDKVVVGVLVGDAVGVKDGCGVEVFIGWVVGGFRIGVLLGIMVC